MDAKPGNPDYEEDEGKSHAAVNWSWVIMSPCRSQSGPQRWSRREMSAHDTGLNDSRKCKGKGNSLIQATFPTPEGQE